MEFEDKCKKEKSEKNTIPKLNDLNEEGDKVE